MKRGGSILILAVLMLAVLPVFFEVKPASAQESSYTIQNVDHQIEVMYSGNVVIRDTVTFSGQITGDFLIGFPYKYGVDILKAMAFSTDQVYPMNLGVRLGNQSGFYGAEVTFPETSPRVLSVVFILGNSFLTATGEDDYSLDFPAYPSLAYSTSRCNVTVVLPTGSSVFNVTKGDGTLFTKSFVKENLPALAYFPASASVFIPSSLVRQITLTSLDRVVSVGPAGDVAVSDSYQVFNNSTEPIRSLKFEVPVSASNFAVKDDVGRDLFMQILSDSSNPLVLPVNVSLLTPMQGGQSVIIDLNYAFPTLPSGQPHFNLNMELFPDFSYYVYTASVSVIPPEGAHIVAPTLSSVSPYSSLDRDLFQETLTVRREGVSYVETDAPVENTLQVVYDYNPLWLSLRPALLVWVIAVVGVVIGAFLRRPRPKAMSKAHKPKTTASFSRDNVKVFVEAYDERGKISEELKSLAVKVQKGKIPRRQYKVQCRALELRSSSLSKQIIELKAKFRNAGGNYANLTKQLDNSEAYVSKIEGDIRYTKTRHRAGELPTEKYKHALDDLRKRKEKAEATINTILIKLREESR